MPSSPRQIPAFARRGFTMIELLVVIGIIVLLAAILVPVVNQVRMAGFKATTTGEMQRIMTACMNYYHDFGAYPGPLSNNQVVPQGPGAQAVNMKLSQNANTNINFDPTKITSSENLVLGLLGLLSPDNSANGTPSYTPPPPQHDVLSLNYNRPASYHYIDYIPEELSPGYAWGNLGAAGNFRYPTDTSAHSTVVNSPELETITDSAIPEFVDHIPDPMPILYLRAYSGVPVGSTPAVDGIVITQNVGGRPAGYQFNFLQLKPYGFLRASRPDYPVPSNLTISAPPEDAAVITYFLNPNIAGQPRGKDAFVLISAGPDRLYGTADDIIVSP